jgi:hypothetical protein
MVAHPRKYLTQTYHIQYIIYIQGLIGKIRKKRRILEAPTADQLGLTWFFMHSHASQ